MNPTTTTLALTAALLALSLLAGPAAAQEPYPQPTTCEMKHKDVDPIKPDTGTFLDDVRVRVYYIYCG